MKKSTFFFVLLLFGYVARAQSGTQTIRGEVVDVQSETPLIGVAVELLDGVGVQGAVTDLEGRFALTQVPVGRQSIRLSYLGYNATTIPNIMVTAGKEVVLKVGMEESVIQMEQVVVKGTVEKDRANNELATVSARSFDLEEVTRYSGGRNDVARLVSNFAGVSTADDSRNDIVIRGNSPTGVLWRLEGIPIPNPNHFATLSTTGGPVSALNPNLLQNSDFLTSAFPAEYGNALGGVFDIGFRSGNKENYEFTAQLAAFSGMEFMAEGPINREKTASFLLSYRHSFVQIADVLGIPIGTNATPNYRDLSFKLDFGKTKIGRISIFGIGGTSDIDFLGDEIDENDLFANPAQDAFVISRLGILGLRHNLLIGDDAYVRTIVSVSSAQNLYDQFNLREGAEEKVLVNDSDDLVNTLALSSFYHKKYNAQFSLRTGVLAQYFHLNTRINDRENRSDWATTRNFKGGMTLLQAYTQAQYKFDEKWTLNAGLHGQYLDLNETSALEPRLALNWAFLPGHRLNLGYGLHHQMQPLPVYFLEEILSDGRSVRTNESLDFTRSHHFVLGYDRRWSGDWHSKVELYYQALSQAPVESQASGFSILNAGADFIFPEIGSLVNAGRGRNYGLELTVEKFFSKGYYGLLTTSIYESKYKGSDGVERNTAFNNNYVVNFLAGKEFKIGRDKRNAITFDMKATTAGGRYYTPVDLNASRIYGMEILQQGVEFSERYDPYFRLDVKFGMQLNSAKRKISHQFYLDLQNITNRENIFVKRYNETTNEVNNVYQSGFFPDLLYRVQF